jgi:pimeloyl-ACP methyl ester carboxylesterase
MASAVNQAKAISGSSNVILVGHSLGVKVAIESYCLESKGVAGLVLIDGRFYPGGIEQQLGRKSRIETIGFREFARTHFASLCVDSSSPALVERVVRRAMQLDPEYAKDIYLDAVGWDARRGEETLRSIDVPVLILQSTYIDENQKRRSLEAGMKAPIIDTFARLVPNSSAKVITEAGHYCTIEAPDQINEAIGDFAARFSSSPAPR